MDSSNIFKVWGLRKRILLNKTSEIDLITVNKNCFCSTHWHKFKINRFVILKGKLRIETPYGKTTLKEGEIFEVRPPLIHRFFAEENSEVIELAYVEFGKISADDIVRISQGGKVIDGREVTLKEMEENGSLNTIKDE